MKLSEICAAIAVDYSGEEVEISSLNTLSDATQNELAFLDNPKYSEQLAQTKAKAVLISPAFISLVPSHTIALTTQEPYLKLALASKLFAPKCMGREGVYPDVDPTAFIAPNAYIGEGARIGKRVTVMPGAFVGDYASIEDDTIIYPNVTVYRDCKIGPRCIIHAGAVIGSDGFGFAHTKMGEHVKIYQNGNVVIESDVEIGANTTIDRAVFGSTLIKKGTKIDNLVQIGHNVIVGEYSILVAQSGMAGSTHTGRNMVLGAQAGISGHLTIAPFTTIAAKSGITKSIKESGKTFAGFPFFEHKRWLKLQAKISHLIK